MYKTRSVAKMVSPGGIETTGSDQAPSNSMEQQDLATLATSSTSSTNILELFSRDITKLSEEGKIIVNIVVKAIAITMQKKDNTIAKLQSKVD